MATQLWTKTWTDTYYDQIPRELAGWLTRRDGGGLTRFQKDVLVVLMNMPRGVDWRGPDQVFISLEDLAEKLGTSRQNAGVQVQKLIAKEWVTIDQKGNKHGVATTYGIAGALTKIEAVTPTTKRGHRHDSSNDDSPRSVTPAPVTTPTHKDPSVDEAFNKAWALWPHPTTAVKNPAGLKSAAKKAFNDYVAAGIPEALHLAEWQAGRMKDFRDKGKPEKRRGFIDMYSTEAINQRDASHAAVRETPKAAPMVAPVTTTKAAPIPTTATISAPVPAPVKVVETPLASAPQSDRAPVAPTATPAPKPEAPARVLAIKMVQDLNYPTYEGNGRLVYLIEHRSWEDVAAEPVVVAAKVIDISTHAGGVVRRDDGEWLEVADWLRGEWATILAPTGTNADVEKAA
ncbi:MAG TPA: hypothetical protein VH374_10795 [Polyangia bacterium]|nr:hypothetical protein [Polyangia bacterium]